MNLRKFAIRPYVFSLPLFFSIGSPFAVQQEGKNSHCNFLFAGCNRQEGSLLDAKKHRLNTSIQPINRRGAIDLSINMIVIIIISLTILAGGILLLNQLISGAEDIKAQLDDQTLRRLDDLLVSQGQQVALASNTAKVQRGESYLFGLGILNTGEVGNSFRLQVKFNKLIGADGKEVSEDVLLIDNGGEKINPSGWARYDRQQLTILEGENVKESILLIVPSNAPSGQYLFKAEVLLPSGERYGNVQRFYVMVK